MKGKVININKSNASGSNNDEILELIRDIMIRRFNSKFRENESIHFNKIRNYKPSLWARITGKDKKLIRSLKYELTSDIIKSMNDVLNFITTITELNDSLQYDKLDDCELNEIRFYVAMFELENDSFLFDNLAFRVEIIEVINLLRELYVYAIEHKSLYDDNNSKLHKWRSLIHNLRLDLKRLSDGIVTDDVKFYIDILNAEKAS